MLADDASVCPDSLAACLDSLVYAVGFEVEFVEFDDRLGTEWVGILHGLPFRRRLVGYNRYTFYWFSPVFFLDKEAFVEFFVVWGEVHVIQEVVVVLFFHLFVFLWVGWVLQ